MGEKLTWVSTEDRLPNCKAEVLILVNGNYRIALLMWDRPGFEDSYEAFQYWEDATDGYEEWEWDDVTHWAELPELPDDLVSRHVNDG